MVVPSSRCAGRAAAAGDLIGIQQLEPRSIRPSLPLGLLLGKSRAPLCSKATRRQGPGMQGTGASLGSLLDAGEAHGILAADFS